MVRYYTLENLGKVTEFKIPLTFVDFETMLSQSRNEWEGAQNS